MSAGHNAFFYGVLIHPKIVLRVTSNDGSHLKLCPAVLLVSPVVYLNHPPTFAYHVDLSSRIIPVIKSRFLEV